MNYLQLVQEAMKKAKVRSGLPTSLTDLVDVGLDFKEYVDDAWRELQEESTNWWFRQKLDQTLAVTTGVDEYAMPTGLETINYRTCSIYTVPKTDERVMRHMPYEEWRMIKDTVDTGDGIPVYMVERPDAVLQIWPPPSEDFTLRFDGVYDIDTMSSDTDTPGSTISGGTQLLDDRYHWVIVYDAVRRYYEDKEDPEGIEKAQNKFLAQHRRLKNKQTPVSYVKPGVLTGWRWRDFRGYR